MPNIDDLKKMFPHAVEATLDYWGDECDEFEPECYCCKAWQELREAWIHATVGKHQANQWIISNWPLWTPITCVREDAEPIYTGAKDGDDRTVRPSTD